MATDNEQGEGAGTYPAGALRAIAGIVLFPFLWIGVTVNFLGLAKRFSFVPGISPEGGVKSGIVALLVTLVVLGIVAAGAAMATGAGIPVIGGGDDGAAEMTPTPTTTPTPTPTPTPTATPTPTPMSEPTPDPADLEALEADVRDRIKRLNQNETLVDVPLAATEYRQSEDGATELWIVYRECDYQDDIQVQRWNVASVYGNAVGNFSGDKPVRLRAYGVTRHKNFSDNMVTIPTPLAQRWYDYKINSTTYEINFQQRLRDPYENERDIAYRMAVADIGEAKAYTLFNDHYSVTERGQEDCPEIGEAPGSGPD